MCVRQPLYLPQPLNEKLDTGLFSHSDGASKTFVRDLVDGQSIETVFVVRERRLAQKRNGENYVRLSLADSSGSLPAICWDDADSVHDAAQPGAVVRVGGKYAVSERYGAQLTVRTLIAAGESEYELDDLVDKPDADVDQMEADFRQLIDTVRNPHLKLLLDALYGERSAAWQRFRAAPAAKFYHEAYPHGLLEHTLSVAQAVSAISTSFPGIDRDLTVTGALIHDIGKIDAYASEGAAIDLTDDGRLLGEIPLGYYMVRREIEQIDGFPWSLARSLLHIQLSHHGELENGSPVIPMTREAWIVHMVDNMGGKLGSFDRLEKGLAEGESWSGFDRALSSFAYFSGREPEASGGEQLPVASGE